MLLNTRRSHWRGLAALLLATAPLLPASAQTPMPPPPPMAPPPPPVNRGPAPPGVAAIVNGKKITRAQVAAQAIKTYGPQIVSSMILLELVNQEAAKQNVVVTPAQMATRLDQIRKQAGERIPGGLDTVLAQQGQTLAQFKQQLSTRLKLEALVSKILPPAAPKARRHLRHLLILTNNPGAAPGDKPPHTDADALAIIKKAQADLKAGKSFEEVANTYTEDPSGQGKGGDLGLADDSTNFDPAFLKAALALKAGEVTPEPVKSSFGYHLIQAVSTSDKPLPTDKALYTEAAAADKIQRLNQALPAYLQTLRAKAKVVDYLTPLPTMPPTGMAPPPMPPR